MKSWIKQTPKGNRLLIETGEEAREFEEKLLAAVNSESLLIPGIDYEDGVRCYSYDVSGLISLEDYLKNRKLNAEELQRLILTPAALADALSSYMLSESNLLLTARLVFADPRSGKPYYPGVSGYEAAFQTDLKDYINLVLCALNPEDKHALAAGFALFKLNCLPDTRLKDLICAIRYVGTSDLPEITDESDEDFSPEGPAIRNEYEKIRSFSLSEDEEAEKKSRFPAGPLRLLQQLKEKILRKRQEKEKNEYLLLPEEEEEGRISTHIIKLIFSILFLCAGMLLLFFFFGAAAAIRAIPAFAILAVSLTLFFMTSYLREKTENVREVRNPGA